MHNDRGEQGSASTSWAAKVSRAAYVRRLVFVVLLPVLAGLTGCSGGKGEVSGKVTYAGQPLPAGRVTFLSETGDHRSYSAAIKDGSFTIVDCAAGPVKISVETFPPVNPVANPDASIAGAPKGITAGFGPAKNTESYASPPGKYVQLPPRFANPDQSGLDYVVTPGKQEHNVELSN